MPVSKPGRPMQNQVLLLALQWQRMLPNPLKRRFKSVTVDAAYRSRKGKKALKIPRNVQRMSPLPRNGSE